MVTAGDAEHPGPPQVSRSAHLAFQAIFETELRFVWRTLRYLGVHPGDLEDVTQEVFMTVLRLLDSQEPVRSLRAWLSTLCYHAASNYRRHARISREVLEEQPECMDDAPDAESTVVAREKLAMVTAVLDRMEPDRKIVLIMHDIDGCAMPEVAEALEIPLATAYSRLRLARRDFLAATTRLHAQGGGHV